MNTSPPTRYELSELLILLHAELSPVIAALTAEPAAQRHLEVESIRVRLGQAHDADTPSEAPDDSWLNPDQYGAAGRAWLVQLDYRLNARDATIQVEPPVALPIPQRCTAVRLFSPLPVRAIKGVSHAWAERLADARITTIGQLADLSDALLQALMQQHRSILPLEMRTKARLLGSELVPIPRSHADASSLYAVAGYTAAALQKAMGPSLSALASRSLSAYLGLLVTVLDGRVLRKLNLGDLRAAIEGEGVAEIP